MVSRGPEADRGRARFASKMGMKVILVRHGDALPKNIDPARGLSDAGKADVRRMGSFLAGSGLRVTRVIHSGKKRAQQTAEILAAAIAPGIPPERVPGLNPDDSTEEVAHDACEWEADTLVVGHLPFLAKLASRLLTGDESACSTMFTPATAACLLRDAECSFHLAWLLGPELLPD